MVKKCTAEAQTLIHALQRQKNLPQAFALSQAAQLKAAVAVNSELILLYWSIGRDILARQAEKGWEQRSSSAFLLTCDEHSLR